MINQYQNPIIRGMHPDPSVVRVGDHYYLANSTFEYYPGITVMVSDDLLNWRTLGGVATVPEQADLRTAKSNEGIFAANIRYHDGYFYVITTNFAEFKTFIIRGKLAEDGSRLTGRSHGQRLTYLGSILTCILKMAIPMFNLLAILIRKGRRQSAR